MGVGRPIIKLISCSSGAGDEKSYAAAVAKGIGNESKLVALRGVEVTDQYGRSRAIRKKPAPDYEATYQKLVEKDYKTEFDAAHKRAATKLPQPKPEDDEAVIMDAADRIAVVAKDLFDKLYAPNGKIEADSGEERTVNVKSKEKSKYRIAAVSKGV